MKKQSTKTKTTLKQNKLPTHRLKSTIHRIIQWNCHGYKANYDGLLLLIAELNLTAICLQETFKNHSDKLNIKTFEEYDYIIDTGQRASGRVSILIRKDITQNKINTHLQAIAVLATLHKTHHLLAMYSTP